ncbi:hypothetical protein JKP88DRAFT_307482 [Tribonema minus]|uniref:Uncharacterized protein n=1 Tax=Tribonema minus TaxID=303371 RepID=A0A835Z6C6_9STRA|nr:hypothetical protein JKP88DRAFT_307482 [Tribonema minus]
MPAEARCCGAAAEAAAACTKPQSAHDALGCMTQEARRCSVTMQPQGQRQRVLTAAAERARRVALRRATTEVMAAHAKLQSAHDALLHDNTGDLAQGPRCAHRSSAICQRGGGDGSCSDCHSDEQHQSSHRFLKRSFAPVHQQQRRHPSSAEKALGVPTGGSGRHSPRACLDGAAGVNPTSRQCQQYWQ